MNTLDVAVRQVVIEARIVEARDTFGRSLGVKLGGGDLRAQRGEMGVRHWWEQSHSIWHQLPKRNHFTGYGSTFDTSGTFVNLPASCPGVRKFWIFVLSIFNSAANRFLTLELSAMEAEGQGKIVSSPRLITADQTKALIEQGTEYPIRLPHLTEPLLLLSRKLF